MKQKLKFMAFFVIFSGAIPLTAVYFCRISRQIMRIFGQIAG